MNIKYYFQKKYNMIIFGFGIFYLVFVCFCIILTEKLTMDENATYVIMSYEFQQMIAIIAHDVHPPLFYIVAYPFFLSGSIYGVKLFSLLTGICSIYLLYDIFKLRKYEFEAGILTLVVISIPNLVMHFAIARMYGLFICLEAASLNLTIRFIDGRYIKHNVLLHIILIVCVRILSLYTHFFSIIMLGFNLLLFGIHFLFLFFDKTKENLENKKLIYTICIITLVLSIFSVFPWIAYQYNQITGNQIEWGVFGIKGLLDFVSVMNSLHNEPIILYPFYLFLNDGFNLYGALWPRNPFRYIINLLIFGLFLVYLIAGIILAEIKTKTVILFVIAAFISSFIGFYIFMSNYAIPHYSRYMAPVIIYVLYPLSLVDYSKTKLTNKKILFLIILINIISFISFFVEYYIFGVILVN